MFAWERSSSFHLVGFYIAAAGTNETTEQICTAVVCMHSRLVCLMTSCGIRNTLRTGDESSVLFCQARSAKAPTALEVPGPLGLADPTISPREFAPVVGPTNY